MKLLLFAISFALSCYCGGQELKVYFGNLHSHTSYSDGSGTPEEAYKYARDMAKIDFLAITEHNHPAAPSRIAAEPELYSGTVSTSLISTAKRFNVDGHFVAIYGQEFSSIGTGNHANILEINKVIQPAEVPNGRWDKLMNDFLPTLTDAQGRLPLMLLNHPSISSSPNNLEYGRDDYADFNEWISKLDSYAQLINMINGPSHQMNQPAGSPSESEFLRYLNMGLHVAPTADQDNHLKNWGNAANPRTAVITTSLTKANILNALRARNVYATEDKNLSVIAKINNRLIGSIFAGAEVPAVNSNLAIEINIEDADEPNAHYTIDVYADSIGGQRMADVVKQVQFTGNGTFQINDVKYKGGNQYFFLKITQTDEDAVLVDRAWLAPVWFEPNAATPASTPIVLTLEVNKVTEEAKISNVGNTDVNLKNWTLVSTVGNQTFKFTANRVVKPGEFVIVTSGPNAVNNGNKVLWTTQYIWSNSGDPGQLLNPQGQIIAATQD